MQLVSQLKVDIIIKLIYFADFNKCAHHVVLLLYTCFKHFEVSIVIGIFTQQGGRPGAGGSGGGAGGMFGFGQTTAKIMKDDVGVRFK